MDLCDRVVFVYCQNCMLETVVCRRTGFLSFCNKRLCKLHDFLSVGILFSVYCGRTSVYFWYIMLDISTLACDFLKCALLLLLLLLRADFACEKMSCLTFALTNAAFFCFGRTGLMLQWSNSPVWFLTEHWCAKTLFHYFDIKKRSHTQSRHYIIVCLSISQFLLSQGYTVCFLAASALLWKHLISCCQCSSLFHFPPDGLNLCV